MYKAFLKRAIDIILSTVGIIILAFPMLILRWRLSWIRPDRCSLSKSVWAYIKPILIS